MPTATKQSRAAPFSKIFTLAEKTVEAAPGTDVFRWYVPDQEDGRSARHGIVVRSVRMYTGARTAAASTALVEIRNQTTTMLSAAMSTTSANTTVTGTLANNNQEVVLAGRYVRIDTNTTSSGANVWSAATGFESLTVQINYDDWPGQRPLRVP